MGRLVAMFYAGGNHCNDNRWTVVIPYVILDDQYRADASLFGADDRFEIRIEYVSAIDGVEIFIFHIAFTFFFCYEYVKEAAQVAQQGGSLRRYIFSFACT